MIYYAVIGPPGVGKTTAVTKALGDPEGEAVNPVPHLTYAEDVIQLGRWRPPMSGTDALSMSIAPAALEFLRSEPAAKVVAEGDRLSHASFLDSVGEFAEVKLVLIDAPAEECLRRAKQRGSKQNPTWIKGRLTKIDRLVAGRSHTLINGANPPDVVAAVLADTLGLTRPRAAPSTRR